MCAAGARSALFVRASALWSAFGLFTTLVFGRSLYAVVQGALGILVSLEAFFSVSRGERAFLKWFAPYMVANTAASVVIGAVTLSGLDVECTGAPNRAGCTVTGLAYALVMILGGASIGLFAAINAAVALATMGEPRATAADTRVSL